MPRTIALIGGSLAVGSAACTAVASAPSPVSAFARPAVRPTRSTPVPTAESSLPAAATSEAPAEDLRSRPLLREFGRDINRRIRATPKAASWPGGCGVDGEAFSRAPAPPRIPTLTLDGSTLASDIRRAFEEGNGVPSGCVVFRLSGQDAKSVRKLAAYAEGFFDAVRGSRPGIDAASRMWTAVDADDQYCVIGYEPEVPPEDEGDSRARGMSFLDTRFYTPEGARPDVGGTDPRIVLPFEVQSALGLSRELLYDGHRATDVLLRIASRITSSILGLDHDAAGTLIDDGSAASGTPTSRGMGTISNSYQRICRYSPQEALAAVPGAAATSDGPTAVQSFDAHVDSTFLTLVPLTDMPGLEIWSPGADGEGQWVRPSAGDHPDAQECADSSERPCYVAAMAGQFTELLSSGGVPTCIHRVIVPSVERAQTQQQGGPDSGRGTFSEYLASLEDDRKVISQGARISSPVLLRPRRGEGARLDVREQLKRGCAHGVQDGSSDCNALLKECDGMVLWDVHSFLCG